MLKLAYQYKEKLQKAYLNIVFNDKYKYWNDGLYWNYEVKLDSDSWNSIEMVSVMDDKVIGFLKASINRQANKVSSLSVINLGEKSNFTFSRDFYKFLEDLFEKFNFNKIEFIVVVGNPIEKMYDKFINKYGGNIIGTWHKSTVLNDNVLHDEKCYEIFREQYLKSKYGRNDL